MLPLENLKVLDLSHLGPGMLCTMILADFGAEVINICSPQVAASGPTEDKNQDVWSFAGQMNLIHESMNRNKKSVALDLKSPDSRKIFLRMVEEADVIVEDFRPGVVKRLGIDYEAIQKINSRIIYCSLSGYGQDGPYWDLPGHDLNYIGMTGALDLVGEKDGPPVIPMFFLADFAGAALHSVIGILLALCGRTAGGRGQFIDIAFTDGVLTLLTPLSHAYLNQGVLAKRGETLYSGSQYCYTVYQCADGKYLSIGCFEPWLWANLCKALEIEDLIPHQLAQGPRRDEIFSRLRTIFLKKNRDEWFEFLRDKNVCVGKVYSLDEVVNDPLLLHRQMIQEISDPVKGLVKYIGPTIKLSRTPGRIRSVAPAPGENTEEVIRKFV